jgi:hypothetical protein
MTVQRALSRKGVDVHLDPRECELLMQLASNAETANGAGSDHAVYAENAQSYLAVSLALGKQLRELASREPHLFHADDTQRLAQNMIDLILGPNGV